MDEVRTAIEPAPTPDEAAAICAALEVLRGDKPAVRLPVRSRWALAGLLGHAPPRGVEDEGSLWSYSSWEGRV